MVKTPRYMIVMDYIQNYIEVNNLKPGDRIPTEQFLMDQFKFSRATIRQAVQELENDGIVEKKHGLGTFVSEVKMAIPMGGFFSFSEEVKKMNLTQKTIIVSSELIKDPPSRVIKRFGMQEGDYIWEIVKQRMIDDDPVLIETSYLPVFVYDQSHDMQLDSVSIYALLKRAGIIRVKGKEKYRPYIPKKEEKELLNIKDESPCIRFSRMLYSDDLLVEYTVSILKPGKIRLETEIDQIL